MRWPAGALLSERRLQLARSVPAHWSWPPPRGLALRVSIVMASPDCRSSGAAICCSASSPGPGTKRRCAQPFRTGTLEKEKSFVAAAPHPSSHHHVTGQTTSTSVATEIEVSECGLLGRLCTGLPNCPRRSSGARRERLHRTAVTPRNAHGSLDLLLMQQSYFSAIAPSLLLYGYHGLR